MLEIGTGSGYQTAILAELAQFVFSLELVERLVEPAKEKLIDLDITNVTILHMDGSLGYEAEAPYDRIIVTAGAPSVPQKLLDQLAPCGRMVIPVGSRIFTGHADMEKGRRWTSFV